MTNRLFVGNLSWNTTDEILRRAFEEDGRNVKEVQIMTDRETGRARGFAFVEMGSSEDAQAAIAAWDGQDLDGRPLRVNVAQERRPREGGGGGGFDRGGGGGGYDRGGRGGGGGGRGGRGGSRGGRGGGGGRDRDFDDRW
ncbi:MAG: RNA-binding protein [Planctomycetes bacterium]|nr:RNA-binding protein [Planctomycetota bacterium]HPF15444.1 RNA-binding protein [Planctomycetota bacterium]HRV81596.1 RNA-binding protein [Planctomycetota bacterium]